LSNDFETTGKIIAGISLPTVIVQEGGYRTRTLGINARRFFEGLYMGSGLRG
jgi:acetoin utilization deacetylase AcuC-like enzyme